MSVYHALSEYQDLELTKILQFRQDYRDQYWLEKDPIYEDRLLWRAQTFRHLVHLLPNQSILEVGCGRGLLTRKLLNVSRNENPITVVSFGNHNSFPDDLLPLVEYHNSSSFPDLLNNRYFDSIIAMDLLDERNSSWFLENIYNVLKPGGEIVFYESNPRNLIHKFRRLVSNYFGKKDTRELLNARELIDLFSKIGFSEPLILYNDFVYAPLTRSLIWLLRNLSIIIENTPGLKTFAGSILIHANKPPNENSRLSISLFEHNELRRAVSVVIPCHNEETNIEPMITKLKDLFGEYIYEIIAIDDNSTDTTPELIRRLASDDPSIKPIFRPPPNGVGRAIADGLRQAEGKYVLTLDCDFHQILPEIRDLFDAAIEGYDVVIGSRFSRHSVLLNYPLQKIIANRGFHLLAQIMFLRGFRDLTNNLKLFRKEVVDRLKLTQPGFAVNAETGLQPLLMGFTVKEVPISWINRTQNMGSSSFKLVQEGISYIKVLLELFYKTHFWLSEFKRD